MNKKILIAVGLVIVVLAAFFILRPRPEEAPAPVQEVTVPIEEPAPVPTPTPTSTPKKKVQALAPMPPAPPAPVVTIHKELIPKDIEIVRVYYANQISGPGSEIEFDINGSGFNAEFEKMITVESGSPDVTIKNLKLITLNQIHGTLVIAAKTPTSISFPQVLIQKKVVFRAAEPFAVIRPGEVLNVILTDMGENGRTGRIRVFTNLTPDTYPLLKIETSTPSIRVVDLAANLPHMVDATIDTGFHPGGGEYDLTVKLGAVKIFERKGFVRIVRPNIGETGLAQQIRSLDGYHRPGDNARFIVTGSGFVPEDAVRVSVRVAGFSAVVSTLTYVGPGRMELVLMIPRDAQIGAYPLELLNGNTTLLNTPNLFQVVDKNWARGLEMKPLLVPGGSGMLALVGRDMGETFVEQIKVETDEPALSIGAFRWVGPDRAEAPIQVGANVVPGDYLLKMTSGGQAITPVMGSILQINPK